MQHASLHSHAGHTGGPKHVIVLWLIACSIRYNLKFKIVLCKVLFLFTTTFVS